MPRINGKYTNCTILRRKLVSIGHLSPDDEIIVDRKEWQTGPCDTPLFNDRERETGECRACESGWTHPHNYRVDCPPDDTQPALPGAELVRDLELSTPEFLAPEPSVPAFELTPPKGKRYQSALFPPSATRKFNNRHED